VGTQSITADVFQFGSMTQKRKSPLIYHDFRAISENFIYRHFHYRYYQEIGGRWQSKRLKVKG
jgi:hypothetical protein